MSQRYSFCSVPLPTVIYAGPRTREEFDRIALPATEHKWSADSVHTLIQNDGRKYESRCTSKFLQDKTSGIDVIFQWFDHRAVEASTAEPAATA